MKSNFEFIIPKSKVESEYIGLNLKEDLPSFIFPCQYFVNDNVSEKEKKIEARKILTILKKIQRDYLTGGINAELEQFYSMIWLIQDYINHGYYVETEQITKISNNGKINWKQTLKNNSILYDGKNVVFKDFYRDKKIIDSSQILTQIYKACLKHSVNEIGFILNVNLTEYSIYEIERDKVFLNTFLKKELNQTFRDYKKTLINHLLSIINNQNSKNKDKGYSIFDSEFEYVFEFLVNKVFGNKEVKEFYNKYYYYLPDENSKYKASKLRPDTIMQYEDVYYIIDSKYYNYGYTKNAKDLPQSSSISKQIGYNHYLRNQLNINDKIKVKSIFMLPYSSKIKDEYLEKIGYAVKENNVDEDDKIAVLLVDLKELINTYLGYSHNLSIKYLIKILK